MPRHLMAFIPVVLCASAACAQVPQQVQRCVSYSAFADEIPSVQQEANQSQPAHTKIVTIDAIDFDGPTVLPNADLAQFVSGLEEHHFDSTSNWLDKVTNEWVRGAWQEEGYFKVTASATCTTVGGDSDDQHVVLHVHVDPGAQYFMGDLHFRPADPRHPMVFRRDELRELVTIQKGDLFAASKINQSDRALCDFYRSRGYVNFTSDFLFDVDDAAREVNLTIRLNPQMQFRIGTLDVDGLDPVTANIWKSLFAPGDIFDEGSIERLFQEYKPILPRDARLREVDLFPRAESGTVDLEFGFDRSPGQKEDR
jgi:outer membrane protein assembly factor BamA